MRVEMTSKFGDPSAAAMGSFSTTLLSVSLAMMHFRGVSNQTMFIGDLCFVASFGLFVCAIWAMINRDTFSFTVLLTFGLFYGGYGTLMLPNLGIAKAYGGYTPEYYNAFGFFILMWAVLNLFFLIASLRLSVVYIMIFTCVEVCFILDGTSQFVKADGNEARYKKMQKAAGAFGFLAALLGYYSTAHYLCEGSLGFALPMGDTSAWFARRKPQNDWEEEALSLRDI